jgi:hypothetical protein
MVDKLLTAVGKASDNGAVQFLLAHLGNPTPRRFQDGQFDFVPLTIETLRLFLGKRVEGVPILRPARDPSFEPRDFWGINAFFRQVEVKDGTARRAAAEVRDTPALNLHFDGEPIIFYEMPSGVLMSTGPVFLVGLNCVQGAALVGAGQILAVDVLDDKLEAARLFGATQTINATRQDAVAAVRTATAGRGADYAFVAVGSARAISQATEMTARGGVTVVVGMPGDNDVQISLNAHVLTEGRTVVGSLVGSTRPDVDVPRLAEWYRQGRLKLNELITRRYPLEQINEALDSMERGLALRNVLVIDPTRMGSP